MVVAGAVADWAAEGWAVGVTGREVAEMEVEVLGAAARVAAAVAVEVAVAQEAARARTVAARAVHWSHQAKRARPCTCCRQGGRG